MRSARNAEPKRLLKHGYRVFSQNDEDGIIAEIFSRIGTTDRTFVEIGVDNGSECNTLNLLAQGWRGIWFEQNAAAVAQARRRLTRLLASNRLSIKQINVTRENIDQLLRDTALSLHPDLLSIDVDGNDYWVWRAITSLRPRVVVIEYNAVWRPPASITMKYNADHAWSEGDVNSGASLSALEKLGREKGYNLVGCCFAGVNAFFVARELCAEQFAAPFSSENHYEPLRAFLLHNPFSRVIGADDQEPV
ncbi:MAG: FkbM family methyltransferase [Deltaproteobacteria bacterium]|nr:FkbM family methyltransferase [Deltaproteobacteria bacterium]